jgi:hypothetical protein
MQVGPRPGPKKSHSATTPAPSLHFIVADQMRDAFAVYQYIQCRIAGNLIST